MPTLKRLVPATAKGTSINVDEWGRRLFVAEEVSTFEPSGSYYLYHGIECNYYDQFHENSGYICTCGLDALIDGVD